MPYDFYDKLLTTQAGFFPVIQSYYYNEWNKFEMPQHFHSRIEIMYIIKGDCTVRSRKEKIRMFSGDFIIINSGTPHALSIDNPRGCMVLNIEFVFDKQVSFAPDFMTLYKNSPELKSMVEQNVEYFRIKDDGEVYRILFSALENVDITKPNRFTLDLWLALLLLSSARLAVTAGSSNSGDYIQSAKDFISRNYFREIHIGDIAEYIHIHPAYLQRLFKKECKISLIDYLTNYRMEKAYYLLSRTNMSIIDIANSVGINSQQYFTRLFKKAMNITPKALRDSKSEGQGSEVFSGDIDWTWRPGLKSSETICDNDLDWLNIIAGGKVPGDGKGYKKDE